MLGLLVLLAADASSAFASSQLPKTCALLKRSEIERALDVDGVTSPEELLSGVCLWRVPKQGSVEERNVTVATSKRDAKGRLDFLLEERDATRVPGLRGAYFTNLNFGSRSIVGIKNGRFVDVGVGFTLNTDDPAAVVPGDPIDRASLKKLWQKVTARLDRF